MAPNARENRPVASQNNNLNNCRRILRNRLAPWARARSGAVTLQLVDSNRARMVASRVAIVDRLLPSSVFNLAVWLSRSRIVRSRAEISRLNAFARSVN